jgi:hypothetical protein
MEWEPKQPSTLTGLMNLATHDPITWGQEELAAIWQHQLRTPLASDLRQTPELRSQEQSFGELFSDPAPPVEVLRSLKEFAKRHRSGSDAALPPEIATALYYMSIALAISRCDRRISDLSEPTLRNGLSWASQQTWLDDPSRALFADVLRRLPDIDSDS